MKKTIFKYIFLFTYLMIQNNHIVAMNHDKNIILDTEPLQCDICFNYYYSIARLKQHKSSVHVEKLFQCTLCPDRFKTKTQLNSHQAVHSSKKPFPCTMCSRSYKYKCSLVEHQKDHSQRHQTPIFLQHKRLINILALQPIQQQQVKSNYPITYMPTHNNFTYYSNANVTNFNDLVGASDYKNINTLEDPFLTLQYK